MVQEHCQSYELRRQVGWWFLFSSLPGEDTWPVAAAGWTRSLHSLDMVESIEHLETT